MRTCLQCPNALHMAKPQFYWVGREFASIARNASNCKNRFGKWFGPCVDPKKRPRLFEPWEWIECWFRGRAVAWATPKPDPPGQG